MPVRRPRAEPSPRDRQLEAWRASVRPPTSDPDGWCHEQLAAIAAETGRDVDELVELWAVIADARRYDGDEDAERVAVDEVRRLTRATP